MINQVCSLTLKISMAVCIILVHITSVRSLENVKKCSPGLFGTGCNYKCQCALNKCKSTGQCETGSECRKGYFGPACQYADLVYTEGQQSNPPELTDHEDSTCFREEKTSVTISLNNFYPLYWLRVTAKQTVSAKPLLMLLNNTTQCPSMAVTFVTNATWDITCSKVLNVMSVTLAGKIVSKLCSVYFSGGRNVALNQQAYQSSVLGGDPTVVGPDKAVDSHTVSYANGGSCSRTSGQDGIETWSLVFKVPVVLLRIILYAAFDFEEQLKEFNLTLLDLDGYQSNIYNAPSESQITYIYYPVNHSATSKIIVTSKGDILTLCELEAFGESWCNNGSMYGFDCEIDCKCENKKFCHPPSGLCTTGCPAGSYGFGCELSCSKNCADNVCSYHLGQCESCISGYLGSYCNLTCDPRHYGDNCTLQCSSYCLTDACNNVNGSCECKDGYRGDTCRDCPLGHFGADCSLLCSLYCSTPDCDNMTGNCDECISGYSGDDCNVCPMSRWGINCTHYCSDNCLDKLCDYIRGTCISCVSGFAGHKCEKELAVAEEILKITIPVVTILLFSILLAVVLCYSLRKRNSKEKPEEDHVPMTSMTSTTS